MRNLKLCAAAAALAMLGSCATRRPPPPPVAVPQPEPARPPSPRPLPPPPPLAWQDAPLTPGDWSYEEDAGRAYASYGRVFTVRCEGSGRISLSRAGASGNALTLRASDSQRALPATVEAGGVIARLAASDPLLDAMAFSRGRFAIEVAGAPLLIIPAWPEPARVIETCRG
ncbi:MAG TPA: hypothetical protein VF704_06915 [Allosphingosinicella sp.]|jgi:hypothetical protein